MSKTLDDKIKETEATLIKYKEAAERLAIAKSALEISMVKTSSSSMVQKWGVKLVREDGNWWVRSAKVDARNRYGEVSGVQFCWTREEAASFDYMDASHLIAEITDEYTYLRDYD